MDWLRKILAGFSKKKKRCSIQHCWLDATKQHKGHDLCDTHYHEYTFDVGISGKKL